MNDPIDHDDKSGSARYTLIVNVPCDTVRQDLIHRFGVFGKVVLAMVVCDKNNRDPHKEWTSSAGYAFVRFNRRSEAQAAIDAANNGLIMINSLRVRADWAKKDSYSRQTINATSSDSESTHSYKVKSSSPMLTRKSSFYNRYKPFETSCFAQSIAPVDRYYSRFGASIPGQHFSIWGLTKDI